MATVIWPYTTWEWDVDFLLTKEEVVHLLYYRLAFYAHIFSSCVVLACGLFMFSHVVLAKWSRVHRYVGRLYVLLILALSAPSGLVMAVYANGGFWAQLSFVILTGLWWWFTYMGYVTARLRDFAAHKRWMMRSYALTLSAITLRIAQMILHGYFHFDPVSQYIFVSWGSWTVNLLVIEGFLRWRWRVVPKRVKPIIVGA